MSGVKALPFILAGFVAVPMLSSFVAVGTFVGVDDQRFEAPAVVSSIETACRYHHGLSRQNRYLTDYIPCVPKRDIAERSGKKLRMVGFSKDRVASIIIQEEGLPPRKGYVVLAFNFVSDDPLAMGSLQARYEDLTLQKGDEIVVGYHAAKRDPKRDVVFYIKHR